MLKAFGRRASKDQGPGTTLKDQGPGTTLIRPPSHFSHQAPDGTWQPYAPAECEAIAKAMEEQPIGLSLIHI